MDKQFKAFEAAWKSGESGGAATAAAAAAVGGEPAVVNPCDKAGSATPAAHPNSGGSSTTQ